MSVTSTSKCMFCTFSRSARHIPATSRNFSSSPGRHARKPKFASIKAPRARLNKVTNLRPEYLESNFTPEQRAAIEAANKVVNNDSIQQVGKTTNPWSMNYVDDLTQIDPSMDHPKRAPWQNTDEKLRLKTDEELTEDFYKLMNNLPDDTEEAAQAWRKFDQSMRLTVGREEAERNPRTALAPDLPKMGKPASKKPARSRDDENGRQEAEPTPALLRLMQMTGLNRSQILKLRVKKLITHGVVNQTRLGKISKSYVLSVAGNGNGLMGIGEGKSEDIVDAGVQSVYKAIRNMQPIMRYENRTIFGDVDGKVSATELQLYARPPGFGLRCQSHIFEMCKAAGITDLAARVTRARNPMNTVKAAMQALLSQKDPEEIAKARGKKLVDVRKVYYANQV